MERAAFGSGRIPKGRGRSVLMEDLIVFIAEKCTIEQCTRANLNTTTEAMAEGVTTSTPVASGSTGTFTTTPTQSNNSILGGMDPN